MNLKELKAAALAATPGPWEVDWYICRADKDDVKAKSANKIGDELWRVAKSIGPITPDHNHWSGTYVAEREDATFIAAANPAIILKLIAVVEAAQNLDAVKGRFHTEQAFVALSDALKELES